MNLARTETIVGALVYEGHVLCPYHASATEVETPEVGGERQGSRLGDEALAGPAR